MKEGKIFYFEKEKVYFIKLVGEISHLVSTNFNCFIEKLFQDKALKDIFLDLSEVKYIDSTNLGLLPKIARGLIKAQQKKTTVLSTNKDVNELLTSMGFHEVFILLQNCKDNSGEFTAIPNTSTSDRKHADILLEAHKMLIEMNDKNKVLFKNVVEVLEKELKTSILDRSKFPKEL